MYSDLTVCYTEVNTLPKKSESLKYIFQSVQRQAKAINMEGRKGNERERDRERSKCYPSHKCQYKQTIR